MNQMATTSINQKIEKNNYYMPSYLNSLTTYKGYSILVTLANADNISDHIKGRALFYLDESISIEEKLNVKSGDGGFMTSVLNGETLERILIKADWSIRIAITQSLLDGFKDGKFNVDLSY